MEDAKSDATGLFMVNDVSERGDDVDVVRNCTFNGVAGKRNAQLYAPKAELTGNTFRSGHAGYGIRIGNGGKSGDDYIGGEIKLDGNRFIEAGGSETAAVQFYTLANTRVELGDNSADDSFRYLYAANNEWIFANNNTFDPPYMYNGSSLELVPKSDGPTPAEGLLTRLWGKYSATDNWDAEVTGRNEWNRNAVMTADKIYVAIAGSAAGQYGVAVFDRATGTYEKTLTSGIETGDCTFNTCGIAKMDDGAIFVSNLARDGQTLKIYRLDPDAGSFTKVLSYKTESGGRYGDVMTSFGTLSDGLLGFVNYYNINSDTAPGYLEFRVADRSWNTTPVRSQYMQKKTDVNQMGGMYLFASQVVGARTAIFASNHEVNYRTLWTYSTNPMDGWYIPGASDAPGAALSTDGTLESNLMDPRWFWWTDGAKYMVYVSVENVGGKPAGYLRIVKMTGSTWIEQFCNTATEAVSEKYPIGSPEDFDATGPVATALEGYCDIYNDGEGNVYILAGVTHTGMSLFKMN